MRFLTRIISSARIILLLTIVRNMNKYLHVENDIRMMFVSNHKNCSNEHPPATMQASHRQRRELREYAGYILNIACYDGNRRNQVIIRVDGACVNKTLQMAPEDEIYTGEIRRASE